LGRAARTLARFAGASARRGAGLAAVLPDRLFRAAGPLATFTVLRPLCAEAVRRAVALRPAVLFVRFVLDFRPFRFAIAGVLSLTVYL
jgi:hypothetical protein